MAGRPPTWRIAIDRRANGGFPGTLLGESGAMDR